MTMVGFAAVIVLSLSGEPGAAVVIGTLWVATCGLLAYWKP